MDVLLVRSTVFALPSQQRVGAIVHDGAADLRLWPGRGPDTDLREVFGDKIQEALEVERKKLPGGRLALGEVVRVHPGRLHCDFLLWAGTREPEPGVEREPAPSLELITRVVTASLEFAASRSAARIAFPALGHGPGEADPAVRLETIVRAANAYLEACFKAGRRPVLEEVLVCHPQGEVIRTAQRKVASLAKTTEPLPQPKPERAAKKASPSRSRTAKPAKKKDLDPDDVHRARLGASPYDRTRTYAVGDWLVHPKFGVGLVDQVTAEGAILVRFEDNQERKMIHARP